MKKLIFTPMLFIVATIYAQNFQPGLKAGVNISNFTGGDFGTIENNALVGFHGGGFIRFIIGHFAIQPEVLFSSQGAKLKNAGTESNFKISYVNIPVMLQYETEGGFYLEAGPQVGFKISEDVPDSTIGDFAKSSDASIALGLGYHSKMGLGIGGRYTVGVSKVGDFDAGAISPDFKQGVIQISLFYTFFNQKK
jgi:hypothetical protein